MTLDATGTLGGSSRSEHAAAPPAPLEQRAASYALALLPGALVVYFAFEAGGFFAGSVGFAALIVTQVLVVRVLFAQRPFDGITRRHALVVAMFAAYAAWTLASALWSHALGRALVEFDRALLYLLILLLFGSVPRHAWRIPLMIRGLAAGSLFVCTVSLITRVLPHLWPTSPGVANNRLSYPITYWNALGILATIAILLLLGITANPRERIYFRALAAAGVPIAAGTLFMTFSRGAIAVLAVALVVFLVTGRSRGLPAAVIAVVPATTVALVVAYHANLLATAHPTTPAAVIQGRHVAVVLGLAAAVALVLRLLLRPLDRWVGRAGQSVHVPKRIRRAAGGAVLASLVAAFLIFGGPGFLAHEYRRSLQASTANPADFRTRLTDPSNRARVDHWRVALHVFTLDPIIGTGAGTYEHEWYRFRRDTGTPVVNAHSLYLQTLSDLGLVGLVLLLGAVLAILVAIARRIRGPNRVAYAALFSAVLAWSLHAGVDWDWEMPAVSAWVFAIGGTALASAAVEQKGTPSEGGWRVPVALLLLVTALTPALLMLSENHLTDAASAFGRGACAPAEAAALSSIDVLGVRPQPYQVLGYCDISDGNVRGAVTAMQKAVQQEPGSWEYLYGLSIAEAYAGMDPRTTFAEAERLNPGDPLEAQMVPVLGTHSPRLWLAIARNAYRETFASGRLTLR